MTATMCFTCRQPIESKFGDQKIVATFLGKLRPVCRDCGEGIKNGDEILRGLRVNGECLADVPDNQPTIKP